MKLIDLFVDGFGAWRKLRLGPLADGVTVLFGPNEAGKSTLLELVRGVLYGFTPSRRARYLPPMDGGPAAGALEVEAEAGRFRITRTDEAAAGKDLLGTVTLLDAAGQPVDADAEKELLGGVDEAVFDNVFALGLGELERMGSLTETEAARELYNLSCGLDRVSLIEVAQALAASRDRLWTAGNAPSVLSELAARQSQLKTAIAAHDGLTERYGAGLAELAKVEEDAAESENVAGELAAQIRILDLASAVRADWRERECLTESLEALGKLGDLPTGACAKLDEWNRRIAARRDQARSFRKKSRKLQARLKQIEVNPAILRHGPRIEILSEQQPWLATLAARVGTLTEEAERLEGELAAEKNRLGLPGIGDPLALPALSSRLLAPLWPIARAARKARQKGKSFSLEISTASQAARKLEKDLEQGLSERGQADVISAAQETGHLVSQLRRRQQLDQRLAQLESQQKELTEKHRELLDAQALPGWILAALGVVFVLGVVLILAGFLLPLAMGGGVSWLLAFFGGIGIAAAAGGKFQLERLHEIALDTAESEVSSLSQQINQTREEQRQLDTQLPDRETPLADRLAKAVEELARLEQLLPMGARRKAAVDDLASAKAGREAARRDFQGAIGRWKKSLRAIGLPEELSPKQLRRLAGAQRQIQQLAGQLANCREDLAHQQKALAHLESQIDHLLDEATSTDGPVALEGEVEEHPTLEDKLRQLAEEHRAQAESEARRQKLARNTRRATRRFREAMESLARFKRRRRDWLRVCGVADEAGLRELASQIDQAAEWTLEREEVSRRIEAALGDHASEPQIRQTLYGHSAEETAAERARLAAELEARWQGLHRLFEERGRLGAELKQMAAGRQLGDLQVELAEVEARMVEAIKRWQMLATTGELFSRLRKHYERHRQPETLAEAGGYLARMTGGRYRRVWTKLENETLVVDDDQGRTLPVEVLSRGAREQLFLSLRLALIGWYARRGTRLPVVLDDLLVNFDAERAKAAAAVLVDFARAGHQMLVFTCHEHIVRLFGGLGVEAQILPDRRGTGLLRPHTETPAPAARIVMPPMPEHTRLDEPHLEVTGPARRSENVPARVVSPVLLVPDESEAEDEDSTEAAWDAERAFAEALAEDITTNKPRQRRAAPPEPVTPVESPSAELSDDDGPLAEEEVAAEDSAEWTARWTGEDGPEWFESLEEPRDESDAA